MRPRTIVVIGDDDAAQVAAKKAQEVNHQARVVVVEKTSLNDVALDMDTRAVTVTTAAGVERTSFDSMIYCGGVQSRRVDIPGLGEISGSYPPLTKGVRGFRRATVIGCGRDGIALSQQLRNEGLSVCVVEKSARLFPRYSFETAQQMRQALARLQVEVHLQEEVVSGERLADGAFRLRLSSGRNLETELVVSAAGMIPNVQLLAQAGAMIAQDGTVFVDETMKTTLNSVYACGEAVSLVKAISQTRQYHPSASMIERGAQVAGANAASVSTERLERMRPCAGSEVVQIGEQYFARTGLSLLELRQTYPEGDFVRSTVIGSMQTLRLFAARTTGEVIGGEIVGERESLRSLDAISLAVVLKLKVDDLLNLEIASEVREAVEQLRSALRRETESISGEKLALWLAQQQPFQWIDVGEAPASLAKHFRRAKHVPLNELRIKLPDLPNNCPLILASPSGREAFQAYRILKEEGFDQVFHLEGGSKMLELLMATTTSRMESITSCG